jgi:predicted metal-dependent phosphoesterase TrpH
MAASAVEAKLMNRRIWLPVTLLAIALAAGVLPEEHPRPALSLGGYRVLAADFHVHPGFLAAGAVAPWDIGMLARRQGLDVLAVTPHNQIYSARIARWFFRRLGGPTIIVGEEIRTLPYHLIAVGIEHRIVPQGTAAEVIDAIHAQGGVAITAHPFNRFWPAFDGEAMKRLDGSEVMHPSVYQTPGAGPALLQFYGRKKLTAIGSSDYHGLGDLGMCRTLVLARSGSERDIVDALRAGKTIVYDLAGVPRGDRELISLFGENRQLREYATPPPHGITAGWISRVCAVAGLLGLLVFGFRIPQSQSVAHRKEPSHAI